MSANDLDAKLEKELVNRHGRIKGGLLGSKVVKNILAKASSLKNKNVPDAANQKLIIELLGRRKNIKTMVNEKLKAISEDCNTDNIRISMGRLLEKAQNMSQLDNVLLFFTPLSAKIKQLCKLNDEEVKKFIENVNLNSGDFLGLVDGFIQKSRRSSITSSIARKPSIKKPAAKSKNRKSSMEILEEYGWK